MSRRPRKTAPGPSAIRDDGALAQPLAGLRVALIHDWLVTLRGGERVLDALCEIFPDATVHTLIRVPGVATPRIEAMRHISAFTDRLPMAHQRHRWLLPLYPTAIESLDLTGFDLVVSSSHCVAKGVISAAGATHVCYCHTPVRYAWDRTDDYIDGSHPILGLARPALHYAARWLRDWDRATVGRVDRFVANSHNTADKIRRFYDREPVVVHPPAECDRFEAAGRSSGEKRDYDLVLSALVPYKRVDLAIEAWRGMPDRRLVVVGDGPERERLQRLAPGNVEMVGRVSEADLPSWYAGARLLAFPGEEDAGIVPVEAQAAGVPVVALRKGGALETVVDGKTGIFFDDPTAAGLAHAVAKLEAAGLSRDACRAHARAFDRSAFVERITATVVEAIAARTALVRAG